MTLPARDPDAHARELIVAALAYAVAGWPVLPVHDPADDGGCSCRRAGCPKPGKHPRTRRGVADASTDVARIAAWWARWPHANVAIATGSLVVLDIDGPDGRATLAALERAHGALPATSRARTARGEHVYLRAGHGVIGCSAGTLGPGIDVRGHGGYVIAPPSRHASGERYRWAARHPPATAPSWLAGLLSARRTPPAPSSPARPVADTARASRYVQSALRGELATVRAARPGTRNSTLNRAAFRLGQLAGAGVIAAEELVGPLLDAARAIGLPDSEALATIGSGLRAGAFYPRAPAPSRDRRSA